MSTKQIKCTDQTQTFHSQRPPHDYNGTLNYKHMGNHTYLSQHPIHAATTALPVNIILLYRKHFAKILIELFFAIIICV